MPSIGDILDQRYEILAELGAGGFATVYRARHIGLLSDHAVKVLHGHLAEDTELRARFLAEGRIQARLRHPNIVAVTDIVTSPLPGLVMEFVEGETLGDYVARRGGRLPLSELTALFLPVADAVATAHAAGVVHRDLKPDNVIVGKRPDGTHEPRVTDFGIAKVLDDSVVGGAKQRTKTGMRMGTLHYMSPEQVRGSADIDARTDVFSLGAILYELVTGRAAFATDSEFETMTNIVNGRYEAPERVVAGLQPAIAACIAGALAPDVAKRTASCVLFQEELRGALAGGRAGEARVTVADIGRSEGVSETEGRDFASASLGTLKWIPAGTFGMGSPERRVTLTKGFWLMEHPVTQGEWQAVTGKNPSHFKAGGARCPVEQVSWEDAVGFARAASKRDGVTYRLPTDAEWERAARGVRSHEEYSGGNDLAAVGWYSGNSGGSTHPVCQKQPNAYGLYDMSGNVWEWASDWYADDDGTTTDPAGPSWGSDRVVRGGYWGSIAQSASVAFRFYGPPNYVRSTIGFRLARSSP
ncbi:hypothetical protein LBMAG42_55590 [Deltaproteobacteria bacterium]|nr:hypothetical protein LBMAG42_55590 [Deltaproteobacteria bacterium]